MAGYDGSDVSGRDKVGSVQRDEETKGRREEGKVERLEGKSETSNVKYPAGTRREKCDIIMNDDHASGRTSRQTMNEKLGLRFRGTQDIIDAAESGLLPPDKIMINVHPQRWTDSFVPWIRELVWQNVKNVVKSGIVRLKD